MVKTRKSLWAAGFALLVCILLLIGTTFAWFTDSVSNSGNKIQAGNLSIALLQKTDTMSDAQERAAAGAEIYGNYTDISDVKVPIFNYTLWEPGYTDYKVLGVKNTGSLALKYKLDIVANGDAGNLADVIDVYVKTSHSPINDEKPASFEALAEADYENVGTLADLMADNDGAAYGNLYPSTADKTPKEAYVAIALHMQETAGNEYQGAFVGSEFDIKLTAMQLNHEEDGFENPNYDINADNTVFHTVNAGTDLGELVNSQDAPVEIDATENLLNQKAFNVTGDVIMNLGLNTINTSDSQISGTNITVKDGGTLTINAEANSYGFTYTAGKLIVDGSDSVLTVNGGRYGDSGYRNSEISARNGGTVYINEGIFSTSGAEGHAVTAEADSTIYINGGSFSTSGANSITIYANGGTIVIEKIDSLTANGSRYGVDNGGKILVSKEYSSSAPTSLASGCTVTDDGDGYWLITKN